MARRATGNAYLSAGTWYARVTIGNGARRSFALPTCSTEEEARARADVLAELAAKLRPLEQRALTAKLLGQAAEGNDEALADVRRAVDRLLASGLARPKGGPAPVTFKDLAERWISGELAREYPDRVNARDFSRDALRLKKHVLSVVLPSGSTLGDTPLKAITLDDAEHVLRGLPANLSRASRRQIGQLISRVMRLAAYPCRLIEASPLPRGFLPARGAAKARGFLYPAEDATLLACSDVPLRYRVLYGFLAREGMRRGEAIRLQWCDLDLERGTLNLERNKTDDPRLWALDIGVVIALRRWRELRGEPAPDKLVFVGLEGEPISFGRLAERLRAHLTIAGVDRAELFRSTESRMALRGHDLRATFVTLSLAAGRSEAWIMDRTGHRSSVQLMNYRRGARTAAELNLGTLLPLHMAIPELRPSGDVPTPGGASGDHEGAKGAGKGAVSKNTAKNKASASGQCSVFAGTLDCQSAASR